ncbi:MAG: hypothetical protein ABSG03_14105 [Bryobacteraceae bacterium]|jgi:hypothetical protein
MRIPVILLLICTGVAVYLARGSRRETNGRSRRPKAGNRDPGEGGLNRVLAAQLGRKTGIAEHRIFSVLEGAGDADLRGRIDDVLEHVTVTFSRRSAADTHKASLQIAYRDGSTVNVDYVAPWDQLPDEVRGEVLRTGKTECVRSWSAPWHNEVA